MSDLLLESEADLHYEEVSSSDDDDADFADAEEDTQQKTPKSPSPPSALQVARLGHRKLLKEYAKKLREFRVESNTITSVKFELTGAQLARPNAVQRVSFTARTPDVGEVGLNKLDYILADRLVFVWAVCKEGCCPKCGSQDLGVKEWPTRMAVRSDGHMVVVLFNRLECKPVEGKPKCRFGFKGCL